MIIFQSLYNPFMPTALMLPRMSLAVRKGSIRVLLSVHDKMPSKRSTVWIWPSMNFFSHTFLPEGSLSKQLILECPFYRQTLHPLERFGELVVINLYAVIHVLPLIRLGSSAAHWFSLFAFNRPCNQWRFFSKPPEGQLTVLIHGLGPKTIHLVFGRPRSGPFFAHHSVTLINLK